MATANCTYNGYAYYNGGYTPSDGYATTTNGGYIGDGSGYGYVAKITIPAAAGAAAGRSLTITLGLMTLYYSDFTLEYWITNEGRPAGPNYGEGPPPIKGTALIHGTANVSGISSSDWTYKTFTTGSTSGIPASGGVYYLWLRCNRNAVAGGGTAPKFVLNYTAVTPCKAPSVRNISPALFENEVNLSWSGAEAGVSNPIVGYDLYIRTGNNGTNWSGWSFLASVKTGGTSGTYSHSPGIARGTYIQYRIYTIGQAGDGYHSPAAEFQAVKKNSLPTTPSNVTVSETLILSGTNVTVSWPGASDPDGNFAHYRVERTQNNGTTWQAVTTTTDTSAKQAVNVPAGSKVQYRVRSEDTLGAVSGFVYCNAISVISPCSAPSSVGVTPSVFETGITLSWSGATGGSFNTITGVQIEYSTSSNGTTWGGWTLLGTVKTTSGSGNYKYNPSLTRGHRIRYRVRVTGAAGAIGYSSYSSTVSTKKNGLPTAPTILAVSDSTPSLGDEITVTWAGADDPDDNIAGYELYIKGKLIQTVETSEKNGTALVSLPDTIADGETAALSIMTVDAYQCKSSSKSVNITRTDRAVYIGSGGEYPRCQVFIGSGSQWKKAQLLYGMNGAWQKILAAPVTAPGFQEVQIKGKEITRNVTALGLPIQGKLYGATTNPIHTEVTVTSGGELKQTLKLSGVDFEEKTGKLVEFDNTLSGPADVTLYGLTTQDEIPSPLVSVENPTVTSRGRNLLDISQFQKNISINADGQVVSISGESGSVIVQVRSNTNYHLYTSQNALDTVLNSRCVRIALFNDYPVLNTTGKRLPNSTTEYAAITTEGATRYVLISYTLNSGHTADDIGEAALTLGATPYPYQPYQESSISTSTVLRGIEVTETQEHNLEWTDNDGTTHNAVSDTYDSSGTITRRIGQKVFDGTESFKINEALSNGSENLYFYYSSLLNRKGEFLKSGLCSHFPVRDAAISTATDACVYFEVGSSVIYFVIADCPTVPEFKAWLAEQAAAGTPVTVDYIFDVPEAEQGEPLDLQSYDGGTSVTSGDCVISARVQAPLRMAGVKAESGATYTDTLGQKWICDEFDFTSQTLTKRVRNGAVLDQPETLTKDLTGYPPQLVSWAGTMILACSGGEMALDFKEAAE